MLIPNLKTFCQDRNIIKVSQRQPSPVDGQRNNSPSPLGGYKVEASETLSETASSGVSPKTNEKPT